MKAIVRRVAKNLRYRTIDKLIDTNIEISSLESLHSKVKESVETCDSGFMLALPPDGDQDRVNKVFLKYGFVDIRFTENALAMDSIPKGGIQLLRDFEFVFGRSELEKLGLEDDSDGFGKSSFESLDEEISANQLHVLTWLSGTKKLESGQRPPLYHNPSRIAFPLQLTISDACITNAPFAWFNRHFYW